MISCAAVAEAGALAQRIADTVAVRRIGTPLDEQEAASDLKALAASSLEHRIESLEDALPRYPSWPLPPHSSRGRIRRCHRQQTGQGSGSGLRLPGR